MDYPLDANIDLLNRLRSLVGNFHVIWEPADDVLLTGTTMTFEFESGSALIEWLTDHTQRSGRITIFCGQRLYLSKPTRATDPIYLLASIPGQEEDAAFSLAPPPGPLVRNTDGYVGKIAATYDDPPLDPDDRSYDDRDDADGEDLPDIADFT